MKLFPGPLVASTAGLKLVYSRKPVDVTTSASTIDLPEAYHNALVDYCLQRAHAQDENWEAAQFKSQAVNQDIQLNAERENIPSREHYPRITVRAEDYWL